MKLYVWTGVDTGAYHGDGVAAVLAHSEEEAQALLAAQDGYYKFAGREAAEFEIVDLDTQRIVVTYAGCDC